MSGYPVPLPQAQAVRQAELLQHIGDMEFDGVQADTSPGGDLAVGHAMTHGLHHPPFGGSQKIVIRWPAALSGICHPWNASSPKEELPSPLYSNPRARL